MFGIDVSEYQGEINWDKVKNKVDFAIIKMGWIGNNNNNTIDAQFERNYSECKRLGIPIGVYVYNYCNNENTAINGANWVIQNLQGKSLELPIYIDMEDSSIQNEGKEKLTNICIAFNSAIEKSSFWAGVYANENWYNNYLEKEEIKKRYTTWIASYSNQEDLYKGEYDIWQNSSDGSVEGIEGAVDTNYMYRDLIAQIGNNQNAGQTKSIDQLAREVIAGKYGNGEDRKKALGDLYNQVQAKVNEILKNKEVIYVVKKGDTLSGIAKKYNMNYLDIAKKNNISNPDKIYVGMRLKIR